MKKQGRCEVEVKRAKGKRKLAELEAGERPYTPGHKIEESKR